MLTSHPIAQFRKNPNFYLMYDGFWFVVCATILAIFAATGFKPLIGGPQWWFAAAFPVLAVGIAMYLGSTTGAGPAEAAALAWDPPVAFRWGGSGAREEADGAHELILGPDAVVQRRELVRDLVEPLADVWVLFLEDRSSLADLFRARARFLPYE